MKIWTEFQKIGFWSKFLANKHDIFFLFEVFKLKYINISFKKHYIDRVYDQNAVKQP